MKKISSIVTNYDSAVTGFSEGKLRDNPGDDTGSSIVAAWGNDLYYAIEAVIKAQNTLGAVSDTVESESNSDFLNALLELADKKVNGVSDWSSATTYSTANTHVMRAGMQFTNIKASGNVNQDPLTTVGYWMPCPDARSLFQMWKEGRIITGGSSAIHNHTNADYRQYFSLGKHRIGGYGGSFFEAYGVHLDGSGVGSSDLSDIIEAWHLKDTWAPGSTGSRTLVDVKGRVARVIDATGGRADVMGELLADQMQGHWHALYDTDSNSGSLWGVSSSLGFQNTTSARYSGANRVQNPVTDGTNGTPRTGNVTADKSFTVGVPYAVIMVPV